MATKFNPFSGTLDYVNPAEDADVTSFTAGETLSGHRVVTTNGSGEAVYAADSSTGSRHGPLGLTLEAAGLGASVRVLLFGEVSEPFWSWTPKAPLYLDAAGNLTETAPSSPALFSVQLGTAVTSTRIVFDPGTPITLAA